VQWTGPSLVPLVSEPREVGEAMAMAVLASPGRPYGVSVSNLSAACVVVPPSAWEGKQFHTVQKSKRCDRRQGPHG